MDDGLRRAPLSYFTEDNHIQYNKSIVYTDHAHCMSMTIFMFVSLMMKTCVVCNLVLTMLPFLYGGATLQL